MALCLFYVAILNHPIFPSSIMSWRRRRRGRKLIGCPTSYQCPSYRTLICTLQARDPAINKKSTVINLFLGFNRLIHSLMRRIADQGSANRLRIINMNYTVELLARAVALEMQSPRWGRKVWPWWVGFLRNYLVTEFALPKVEYSTGLDIECLESLCKYFFECPSD